MSKLSRRNLLLAGGAAAFAAVSGTSSAQETASKFPFRLCLNFATLIGFKLPFEEEIDIAAKAGYRHIEPWPGKIKEFLDKGGKLSEAKKRIDGHGMSVEGFCTFFPWIVDDADKRAAGLEQMKENIGWAHELGTTRIAATPAGATEQRLDDFRVLGDRYRTILDVAEKSNVTPMLEIWGRSQTLNSLADALAIAAWTGHPRAELLLDVFHLYRGGSPFEGLALLNGRTLRTFHVHDYPADPPRERLQDKDRVYCGDGVAPLPMIFRTLRDIGFTGCLSFEVFNPTYWATNDPLLVAKTSLEKMKAVLEKSESESAVPER